MLSLRNFSAVAILTLCCLASGPALADCKNPEEPKGTIVYNSAFHVPQYCDGTNWLALGAILPSAGGTCTDPAGNEGDILYNDAFDVPQFCNGTQWVAMIGRVLEGCKAPQLCQNVGDVCDDGNAGNNPDPVFAGLLFYGNSCKQVFAPQSDQGISTKWKTSGGTNDIATDSTENGRINDAQVPDSDDFPAFKLCKDLIDGGYTDWYLPARTELDLLWRNNAAIGGFATTQDYLSSTESSTDTNYAWFQNFNYGTQGSTLKTNNRYVRCIRSENASFGVMHCTPPDLCPDVGDVCDDGNAANNPDPKFAGFMVYNDSSCEPLYVTQNNQSLDAQWKISTGTNDIPTDSTVDGKINDAQVPNSTDFEAFKLCKDLDYGGYDDWYLPARDELHLLWKNKTAIGNFTASYYWSSTEYNADATWDEIFSYGYQYYGRNKTSTVDVRCARRD